jgi:hypothetical protein
VPRLASSFRVQVSELDDAAEVDAPLNDFTSLPPVAARAAHRRVTSPRWCATGTRCQFGIGRGTAALAGELGSHRRLRFRAGMVDGCAAHAVGCRRARS